MECFTDFSAFLAAEAPLLPPLFSLITVGAAGAEAPQLLHELQDGAAGAGGGAYEDGEMMIGWFSLVAVAASPFGEEP